MGSCPRLAHPFFLDIRVQHPNPQIGSHTDDLSLKNIWARIPTAVSSFPITATATRAGSPLGGLLYIVVPRGAFLGTVQITVQGAIQAPYFKLGTTSPVRTWALCNAVHGRHCCGIVGFALCPQH